MSNENSNLDNLSYPTMNPAPQELKTAQSRNVTLEDWNRMQLRLSLMEDFLSWLLNEYTPAVKNSFDNAQDTMEAAFEAYLNSHPFAHLVDGKVPEEQLPSYVNDVLEYANTTFFPSTGETGKIYIAKDTNLTYRWGGSEYVNLSSPLALGTTSSTAYRGDLGAANAAAIALLQTAMSGKQDNLTFDTAPTGESSNPVTSGGIKTAIDNLRSEMPFKVISAPASNTLTDAEKTAIISGAYVDSWSNKKNIVFFPANKHTDNVWYGFMIYSTVATREALCQYYINDNTNAFSYTDSTFQIESGAVKVINNKAIPAYPSSTGTFVLESVDGTLSWVGKQEITVVDSLPMATATSADFVQYSEKLYRKKTISQTAVTDLTNTVWTFNDTLDNLPSRTRSLTVSYYLNFTSNSLSYTEFKDEDYTLYYGDTAVYTTGDVGWINDDYKTISISGGDDVEDAALIEWFFSNATLVSGGTVTYSYSYEVVIPLDSAPTANSTNGVTSGGVAAAIAIVDAIAKGAQQAIGYSNYSTMITAFNTLANTAYRVGQSVYIVTVDVPDLWISSVEQSSATYTYVDDATFVSALDVNGYVQVGYYKLSKLETGKVDLTGVVRGVSANGTALTPDANGNVNIPKAAYGVFGLISGPTDPHNTGVALDSTSKAPVLYVEAITSSLWSSKRNTNPSGTGNSQPIVIGNMDYAVKLAMTDGIGAAWTTSEQSAARARMGIADTVSESYTIPTSDWTALSSSSPYTYSATVTATHTIGNDTTIELINDQPVLFATNGFAIASVSGQVVTIYSIGAPSASVTLEVQYNG